MVNVPGSNPPKAGSQLMTACCLFVQSLSLSSHLVIMEVLLKLPWNIGSHKTLVTLGKLNKISFNVLELLSNKSQVGVSCYVHQIMTM